MPALSARRTRIVAYFRAYQAEHYLPPTVEEIGAACSIPSKSTVAYHLERLIAAGVLRRHRDKVYLPPEYHAGSPRRVTAADEEGSG